MKPNTKTRILAILSIFSLFTLWFRAPQTAQAQATPAGTAAEMLAEINALRAANGLAPMEENVLLNIAAQNHAEAIAAGEANGHTGADGSTPTDRARAVGYNVAYVTENWAGGIGLTVSVCVYDKWRDAAHSDNMLDPSRKEFGAGVAVDSSGMTIYVVDFSNFDTNGDQPVGETGNTATPSGPTATLAPLIQPVITSTPGPDGSVIHVVQYGQTLWTISDAYGVPLAEILALNGLTEDSSIYPEEQLLIVQGTGETPKASETAGTLVKITATVTPTPTEAAADEMVTVTPTPTETPEPRTSFLTNIFSGDTLWVGIGLVAVSVFGIVLLLFTSARLR